MLALAIASLLAAGCGGESGEEGERLSQASLLDVDSLPDPVLTDEDVAEQEQDSAERTYLAYWQAAQFGDLAAALGYFAPQTVEAVGVGTLNAAIRSQVSLMRGTRPVFVSEAETDPGLTSLRYAIRGIEGEVITATAVLREAGDGWEIVYDSFLDGAIGATIEGRAQARIDPASATASPEAARAGAAATARQSRYLNELTEGG